MPTLLWAICRKTGKGRETRRHPPCRNESRKHRVHSKEAEAPKCGRTCPKPQANQKTVKWAKPGLLAEPPILRTRDRGVQCPGPLGAKTSNTLQKGKMHSHFPNAMCLDDSARVLGPRTHSHTQQQDGRVAWAFDLSPVTSPSIHCLSWSRHQARCHDAHF